MTKREVLERLDSVELTEWEAKDRLSPLDAARRAELSAGIIAALIHNTHVEDAKPASHFMVKWGEEYWPVDPSDLPAETPVENKIDAVFGAIALMNKGN